VKWGKCRHQSGRKEQENRDFFPEPDQPAEIIRKRLNDPAFVQSLAEAVIKIQMIIMPGHRIIYQTKILIY